MTTTRSRFADTFIPGYAGHTSGTQTAVDRIVIHATVSPCEIGGARNVARYFQSPGAGGLAHYVADPAETVQCADENVVCWHAPPNARSIGVELCDPQAGDPGRWSDRDHQAMLARAAALVVDVAGRWQVPLVRLSAADLLAGKRGICGHADVSAAWHESDHDDPQPAFPWAQFMGLLAPHPIPSPTEEPDVAAIITCTDKTHSGATLVVDGPLVFSASSGADLGPYPDAAHRQVRPGIFDAYARKAVDAHDPKAGK